MEQSVRYCIVLVVITAAIVHGTSLATAMAQRDVGMMLPSIALPPGFRIGVYASEVPGARSMAMSPSGVLFVGTRENGQVYAVLDRDQDMQADEVITIAQGLNMPNGVAIRDGDLYVAEVHRILRYAQIESRLKEKITPEVIYDTFPRDRHHGWKFIRFGPDGALYVPVGAPCNVCRKENSVYATITRMNPDGSGFDIFANGIRNSVGFDWHPQTGELWFTDNGRDWLGDDNPPDELNRAPVQGMHFGFPFCHGKDIPDPEFAIPRGCGRFTPPAVPLGAHVAALGMRFYTGRMFPPGYFNQIFLAEHGSWNRSQKAGYRVSLVRIAGNRVLSYEPFAEGWLIGDYSWGRPVDVEIMGDGSMLVSDDLNGVIYRISYD